MRDREKYVQLKTQLGKVFTSSRVVTISLSTEQSLGFNLTLIFECQLQNLLVLRLNTSNKELEGTSNIL